DLVARAPLAFRLLGTQRAAEVEKWRDVERRPPTPLRVGPRHRAGDDADWPRTGRRIGRARRAQAHRRLLLVARLGRAVRQQVDPRRLDAPPAGGKAFDCELVSVDDLGL